MSPRLLFGVNLAVGGAVLGWVLYTFGGPAIDLLRADLSPLLLAFLGTAALALLTLTWRWRYLLAGLDAPAPLLPLVLFRSAAHSVAVLVPSAKLGGDPLRAWLAARRHVRGADAIATVALDRTLELGSSAPFSILFVTILVQQGIPELRSALAVVAIGTLGLLLGVAIAMRRLRRGAGLVTALVRGTRLDRFASVEEQMGLLVEAEAGVVRLVEPERMLVSFGLGLVANVLVIAEFALLLAAFGLPTNVPAVAAAIFATGAATALPVPAGVGVLEGAQIWLFGMLGYPPDVGLAVGLAARLREFVWMVPGLGYLGVRSVGASLRRVRAA